MAETSNLVERMSLMMFAALVVVSACGGTTTAPEISNVVPVASTISETVPASSTTSSSVAAAETQLLDVIELESLSIHVDPLAMDLEETPLLVDLLTEIITENSLREPAVAVLYATGQESTRWAMETTRELDCLHYTDPQMYDVVGWGNTCGFLMRVDAMNLDCGSTDFCKNGLVAAAHEFFHVIGDQAVEPCVCEPLIYGNRLPNWLNEGLADYFGYATIFGDDPEWLEGAIVALRDRALRPEVNTNLVDIERLWGEGFGSDWFQYLYERSFFAVALLVQQFDEETVFDTFLDNVVTTGHFSSGFETTFGKTEAQFSDEFDAWLQTL